MERIDMAYKSIRSEGKRDEQVLGMFIELADETTELMNKKGISLTVEDFLKERVETSSDPVDELAGIIELKEVEAQKLIETEKWY